MLNEFTNKLQLGLKAKLDLEEVKRTFEDSSSAFLDGLLKDNSKLNSIVKGFSGGLTSGLTTVGLTFLSELGSLLSDSWQELSELLNYSRLSNRDVRETMFQYGFSSAQAYGFDRAMELLGIQSEEDLYYMNPSQQKLFYDKFTQYSEKYSKLYDAGFFDSLEEYQVEMQDFRNELELEVVGFLMENKDSIMAGMKGILSIVEIVGEGFTSLLSFFGKDTESSRIAAANDILRSYSVTNNSSNVSQTNNYTISGTNDTVLNELGKLNYTSYIKLLNRG